jgi:glutathione S-transferase
MKLYYFPGVCSLASHIALHETGLPFAIEKYNPATQKTESGEDFIKINPKSYVPALKLDDGSVLTEGVAILQYIADQNPASGLAPRAGTLERYRLQEWLTYISSEVHKSFTPLFNQAAAEEVKNYARDLVGKRLVYLEAQLAGRTFLMDSGFTVADAYLFVVLNWSSRVAIDLTPFPNVREYMARIAARPAVQAALKAEGLLK